MLDMQARLVRCEGMLEHYSQELHSQGQQVMFLTQWSQQFVPMPVHTFAKFLHANWPVFGLENLNDDAKLKRAANGLGA